MTTKKLRPVSIIWTPAMDEQLAQMATDRVPVKQQAAILNMSRESVVKRRGEIGVFSHVKVWTEAHSTRAAELYATGMSMQAIGDAVGFADTTVLDHLSKDGVYVFRREKGAAEPPPPKTHVEFEGLILTKATRYVTDFKMAGQLAERVPVSVSAGCGWAA